MITKQVQFFFSPPPRQREQRTKCPDVIVKLPVTYSLWSPHGGLPRLSSGPSCHIEVICSLQHRGFSAFPSALLKNLPSLPTFISRAPVPPPHVLVAEESYRRTFIYALGPRQRLVIQEEERAACYMTGLSAGDTRSRVSQRQICAGVCHLEVAAAAR